MPTSTSRLALQQPIGTDSPSELRIADTTNTGILDAATLFDPDLFANQPSAGSTPAGNIFYATDTDLYYINSGSVWSLLSIYGSGYGDLIQTTASISTTAVAGNIYTCAPSITLTLPPPSAGAIVGMLAQSSVTGSTAVVVTYGSGAGKIFAQGALAVSSIKVGGAQNTLIFQSDGTNWQVFGGRNDTGWQALTLTTGVTAAAFTSGSGFSYSTTPGVRLIGTRALLRGGLTGPSSHGSTTSWATIPAGYRPGSAFFYPTVVLSTAQTAIQISTAGVITDENSFFGSGANTILLDGVIYDVS